MEIVGLIAALVAIVVLVKVGMLYLRNINQTTGYNPLGFLNVLLLIGFFICAIVGVNYLASTETARGVLFCIASAGCIGGLIFRNCVLKSVPKIILVTFFQLFAPLLTLVGILYKRSGGIMGNAAVQANLGGGSTTSSQDTSGAFSGFATKKKAPAKEYTTAQESLATSEGFLNAEDAKKKGFDPSQYI